MKPIKSNQTKTKESKTKIPLSWLIKYCDYEVSFAKTRKGCLVDVGVQDFNQRQGYELKQTHFSLIYQGPIAFPPKIRPTMNVLERKSQISME
jgi:hypothetical protein